MSFEAAAQPYVRALSNVERRVMVAAEVAEALAPRRELAPAP
jgi:hypothetical protein